MSTLAKTFGPSAEDIAATLLEENQLSLLHTKHKKGCLFVCLFACLFVYVSVCRKERFGIINEYYIV